MFWQYWWLDAVSSDWNVSIAFKGQAITGVWPYTYYSKFGIKMMQNPGMTPYLGPHIFYPSDIKETNRDSFEHEVIENLLQTVPDPPVWTLSLQPTIKQAGLFRYFGLKSMVQQTFIIDLSQPEQTIYANFKEPLRRNLKNAEHEFTISESTDYLMELYRNQKVTLHEKGIMQAHSYEAMERLFLSTKVNNAGTLYSAFKDGVLQAGIWVVWDRDKTYYLMGAKSSSAEGYKATSYLLWHAIKEAQKRGNRYFDFEGSMDYGVERFFRSFGGQRDMYIILQKNASVAWKLISLIKNR